MGYLAYQEIQILRVIQVNATHGVGSTGKICASISKMLSAEEIENYVLYCGNKSDRPGGICYAGKGYIKVQALKNKLLGGYGFYSRSATKKLIRILECVKPDIVHLHNIHGHNCNLTMLFEYLQKSNVKVCWTFHDCWAITGYCPHFAMAGCPKWKSGCSQCPQYRSFTWIFDRSAWLYQRKKQLFTALPMTIVTPSHWLSDIVKQSFLLDSQVEVIHNGINLEVFQPRESDFREKYGCGSKWIILGVAFDWGVRKGLDILIQLAQRLDERFQIVLVGTNKQIDRQLPDSIISIHRTQNQQELAEIYSAADVFVNPTREDNYPTVNMEALACGTPVLTFDTGGSAEIPDETCGAVVAKDDFASFMQQVIRICSEKPYRREACCRRAQSFNEKERYAEYLQLYKELHHDRAAKS